MLVEPIYNEKIIKLHVFENMKTFQKSTLSSVSTLTSHFHVWHYFKKFIIVGSVSSSFLWYQNLFVLHF